MPNPDNYPAGSADPEGITQPAGTDWGDDDRRVPSDPGRLVLRYAPGGGVLVTDEHGNEQTLDRNGLDDLINNIFANKYHNLAEKPTTRTGSTLPPSDSQPVQPPVQPKTSADDVLQG